MKLFLAACLISVSAIAIEPIDREAWLSKEPANPSAVQIPHTFCGLYCKLAHIPSGACKKYGVGLFAEDVATGERMAHREFDEFETLEEAKAAGQSNPRCR